jgi:hypothetical protein
MSAAKKPLGDPLARAATLGKIGARSEPVVSPPQDISVSDPSTIQQPGLLNTQQSRSPESALDREVTVVPTRAARKQQTVYLPPALIKRLKLYAVETDQEMSDVVAEALERFLRGE